MRAAVTTGEGDFEVVTLPDPTPGPDELIVRVAACGVCGSDLKAQPLMPPGTVMGHEFGGEVVAVGAVASGWREGMRAAVLPLASCGGCARCADGSVAHCPSVRYIGMGQDAGGFSDLAVVPTRSAFLFPDDLPATFAALVEPFAVGLHGVRRADVGYGSHVVVIGAGGVGLTTLAWARLAGAAIPATQNFRVALRSYTPTTAPRTSGSGFRHRAGSKAWLTTLVASVLVPVQEMVPWSRMAMGSQRARAWLTCCSTMSRETPWSRSCSRLR
jgi:D-arabinose 1-dehydrogenase-like Zn-dependent alcohol dehydrogenase